MVRVIGHKYRSRYFKIPQISHTIFMPNTRWNHAITYTNTYILLTECEVCTGKISAPPGLGSTDRAASARSPYWTSTGQREYLSTHTCGKSVERQCCFTYQEDLAQTCSWWRKDYAKNTRNNDLGTGEKKQLSKRFQPAKARRLHATAYFVN